MVEDLYGSGRCLTCHQKEGDSALNVYGHAWEEAGEDRDAFKKVDAGDVDRDGFTNRVELKAGSSPGDAKSTPTATVATGVHSPAGISIPRDELEHVLGVVEKVEVVEPEMEAKIVKGIEKGVGGVLSAEERRPTIFVGLNDGKRGNAAMFAFPRVGKQRFTVLVGLDVAGHIGKVVLFRAGDAMPQEFRGYLECLAGRDKKHISAPGTGGCPVLVNLRKEHLALARAVRVAVWTFSEVFSIGTDLASYTR
jgi:hypothetical protein